MSWCEYGHHQRQGEYDGWFEPETGVCPECHKEVVTESKIWQNGYYHERDNAVEILRAQSKGSSLTEVVLNVGSGFLVSLAMMQWVICPVFDLQLKVVDNVNVTAIFTFVSVARGYMWRRMFNWLGQRKNQKFWSGGDWNRFPVE